MRLHSAFADSAEAASASLCSGMVAALKPRKQSVAGDWGCLAVSSETARRRVSVVDDSECECAGKGGYDLVEALERARGLTEPNCALVMATLVP